MELSCLYANHSNSVRSSDGWLKLRFCPFVRVENFQSPIDILWSHNMRKHSNGGGGGVIFNPKKIVED